MASASCAPRQSRVETVNTVTGTKEGKETKRQPVAILASTTEVGLQIAANTPLLCPTWLVETVVEERERVNTVNGLVLTLEWVAGIALLGAGAAISADALINDDDERQLQSFESPEEQQIVGASTLGVGLVMGTVALVDSLGARDETLESRNFERERAGSRKESSCGQEAAASQTIQLTLEGPDQSHTLGTTDADGKLELAWQDLPVSLFENRPRGTEAKLTVQDRVVGTLSLQAGWDVHAAAAKNALPPGNNEALAAYRTRFPGAPETVAKEDAAQKAEETKQQVAAFEAALQAKDLELARTNLESLKARVGPEQLALFEKRFATVEASLGQEHALAQAKKAVARLSDADASSAHVMLAQKAMQRAKDLGVDAYLLGETEQSFAKSRDAIVLRLTKEALSMEPTQGLPVLKELLTLVTESKAVNRAISRLTSKALRTGLKAAKTQTRKNEFSAALDTLGSLEELIGSNAKLDKEREGIKKAQLRAEKKEEQRQARLAQKQQREEKARLAAEARAAAKAKKLEEQRLAAKAAGEKREAARLARQLAKAEAAAKRAEERRLAKAAATLAAAEAAAARKAKREEAKQAAEARAAERAAQRAEAKRSAEERKAAARAAAEQKRAAQIARRESKRLAKEQARQLRRQKQEEAKRRRLAAKGGVSKQAPVASYLEFELDKSLSKTDALTNLILPAGCQAKVTNVLATPPACRDCKAAPMRRVQLSCPKGSVDFLKSEARVWARCQTSSCADCRQLTTTSISNLAVSSVAPKVVRTCQ